MDLNTLLIWIVVISCGGTLARLLKSRAWRRNGWAILSTAVLAITGIAGFAQPTIAGWIGGSLWLALFLIPSLLQRGMMRASMRQRYRLAEFFAHLARLLHPTDGWWQQPMLFRALAIAERGEIERAVELLTILAAKHPDMRRVATVQSFRIARRWHELITWVDFDLGPAGVAREPALAAIYIRALGEIGALNEMVETLDRITPAMQQPQHAYTRAMARLFTFAFWGDVNEVTTICDDALAGIRRDVREFWLATAQLAAGNTAAGQERMFKLIQTAGPSIHIAAEDRLARPIARADEILSPESRLTSTSSVESRLSALSIQRQEEDRFSGRIGPRPWRRAATIALVLINLAVFAIEIRRGGSENDFVLYRMGAVHPDAVIARHEWWRILAANFLHFGFAHIAFNMLALWVLGPFVEAALGKIRYLAVYIFSGIVALWAAVAMQRLGLIAVDFLVGASGCIMGLVGATAAILLRAHVTEKTAVAAQRLRWVMFIVIVQVIFDAMTPQVSSTAHIAGLLAGFSITVMLRHRTTRIHVPRVLP